MPDILLNAFRPSLKLDVSALILGDIALKKLLID
jgi:hypothetical protein